MKPFGVNFRIGVATIGIVGALFVWTSPAIAGVTEDSGLQELWEQYPLDSSAGYTVRSDSAADAPVERDRGTPSSVEAGTGSREAWQVAVGLAALALLIAATSVALLQSFGSPGLLRLPLRERRGPWNVRLSPQPAGTYGSHQVLEGLLRAATASAPQPPLSPGAAAMSESPTATRSTGRTVAFASGETPKSSASRTDGLKQTQPIDATTLLKIKEQARSAHSKEKLTKAERNLLKEKLAARPRHPSARAKGETAAVEDKRIDIKHTTVVRSVPKPGERRIRRSSSTRQVPATPSTRTCEIQWWRGYVMSEFFALETNDDGAERVLASSPSFRWRKRDAPIETPEAAAALWALVNHLQKEGWTLAGRGESWFNLRLESKEALDVLGGISDHG
jgi:hypothetical protein